MICENIKRLIQFFCTCSMVASKFDHKYATPQRFTHFWFDILILVFIKHCTSNSPVFIPGRRRTTVGTYQMDTQPNHFEWTLEGISWKGAISVLLSVARLLRGPLRP